MNIHENVNYYKIHRPIWRHISVYFRVMTSSVYNNNNNYYNSLSPSTIVVSRGQRSREILLPDRYTSEHCAGQRKTNEKTNEKKKLVIRRYPGAKARHVFRRFTRDNIKNVSGKKKIRQLRSLSYLFRAG